MAHLVWQFVLPTRNFTGFLGKHCREVSYSSAPPAPLPSPNDPEARLSKVFRPPSSAFTAVPTASKRYAWPLFGLERIQEPTEQHRKLAKQIFSAGSRYLGDQAALSGPNAPAPTWAEILIMGRSNAGKSTLLNTLLGSRDNKFVPVSRHPGKTVGLDFYAVGPSPHPSFVLVDSPGYGFSARGRNTHEQWMDVIAGYLGNRRRDVLERITLLIDARLGLGALDEEMLRRFDDGGLPCHVVATKADTVSQGQLEALALRTATVLSRFAMPYPVFNAVSARTGEGMQELKLALVQTAKLTRR